MFTMGTHTEGYTSGTRGHANGAADKRRSPRLQKDRFAQAKVNYQSRPGFSEMVQVRLVDVSATGCGIVSSVKLAPGSIVSIAGPFSADGQARESRMRARVVWAAANPGGGFRCGLAFEEDFNGASTGTKEEPAPISEDTPDLYEVLQISAKADMDTIHRVFRLLAQRFHPDNTESGDPDMFRKVYDAYKVLSDPERRAAYDAQLQRLQTRRWKIFERPQAASGVAAERRKRQGALALLYVKRMQTPESPGLSLPDLEDLLGVPREHLEFSLWYLRENGLITRTDNGRTVITAKGVDEAERLESDPDGPKLFLPSAHDGATAG
ncbi:MAG: DnaJ domain-containing protein [Acidobacteria bacterium]|nr:DnaJ domain-containing protein [Acidobacteriota bacterium]